MNATHKVLRFFTLALVAFGIGQDAKLLVSGQNATLLSNNSVRPANNTLTLPNISPVMSTASPDPSPGSPSSLRLNNMVTEWNREVQIILRENNISNIAPRMFSFVHLAMWRALKAHKDASLNPQSAPAVAVASYAAQATLKAVMPLRFDSISDVYIKQTRGFTESERNEARRVAEPIVNALLNSRVGDGFTAVIPPPPLRGTPGQFVDTGTPSTQPFQAYATTQSLLLPANLSEWESIASFTPPIEVPSDAYSAQYTAAFLYGSQNSTLRTAEQTETATFWADAGQLSRNGSWQVAGTQAQWNQLFIGTLPASLSIESTAELLAQLNVGIFDCTTSIYYLKYAFNRWRPISAIRNGDPTHTPQPDWINFLQPLDTPSYPSLYGCYAGFVSSFLNSYYRRDAFSFIAATENIGKDGYVLPPRVYTSFSQVAAEVSQSRYFGGAEFPIDSAVTLNYGRAIARYHRINWGMLDI